MAERSALDDIASVTLQHYDSNAQGFFAGTVDHDVSQNIGALCNAITAPAPWTILDLGCGPGRDLATFTRLGHHAIGLDGSAEFVAMARAYSGCEVWHQSFLHLDLPEAWFDGVYANASLFHVPRAALPGVLAQLCATLKQGGVLFSSNPRGDNQEGWSVHVTGVTTITPRGKRTWKRQGLWKWSITTGRRVCRATSSPGWPASGAKCRVMPRCNTPSNSRMPRAWNGKLQSRSRGMFDSGALIWHLTVR